MRINPDDLHLVGQLSDHLFTEHGLADAEAQMNNGWQRKSKWECGETRIIDLVGQAFDTWRQELKAIADGQGEVDIHQNASLRTVIDIEIDTQTGKNLSGKITQGVRLVMKINNAGNTEIITAFPV